MADLETNHLMVRSPGGYSMISNNTISGPERGNLNELLETMRGTLDHLGGVFDTLGEHTAQVASLGPQMTTAHQVAKLKKQIVLQDERQEQRIQDIKVLLRDVLKQQIAEHLQLHVQKMIREKIQEQVEKQVKEQLSVQFPEALREQVAQHKTQLAGVKNSLHNSEARRANALLRSHHLKEPLRPLVMANGGVSPRFPQDLSELFALDSPTAKLIIADYNLPVKEGDTKESLLNRFIGFIGAQFQLIPPPERPSLVTAI